MLDHAVVQRVHAPGVQRRHRELQADDERRIGEHHRDEVRVDAEARQARGAQHGHEHAGHRHLPHAEAVEQAARHKAREGADDGTGQHGQTGHSGREPEGALNVQRRDDLGTQERRLHDDDDAGRRGIGARLQDAHVQHGLRQLQLAPHVQSHQHDAHGDKPQRERHIRRRSEGGKPVEQAHKAHRGQRHRQLVERRAGEIAVVAQQARGEHHHDDTERRHNGEQRPPAHGIHQQAR